MIAPVVIFAVGNPSRGDDAIGPMLHGQLEKWLKNENLSDQFDLIEDFQLQIEHVLDLQGRELALFIDAGAHTPEPFTFGRIAPPRELRRALRQPALIVGHAADPIHPFADAGKLADEMPRGRLLTARSAAEWRVIPKRLDGELCAFLDMVWGQPQSVAKAAS